MKTLNGTLAGFVFLGVCILLALLLLLGITTTLVSGRPFATAPVILGGISGGFRKR